MPDKFIVPERVTREAYIDLLEQLEAFRAALETIAQPMPETDGDWGATYDWHKSAIARRDIARAALALASSPASEPKEGA